MGYAKNLLTNTVGVTHPRQMADDLQKDRSRIDVEIDDFYLNQLEKISALHNKKVNTIIMEILSQMIQEYEYARTEKGDHERHKIKNGNLDVGRIG